MSKGTLYSNEYAAHPTEGGTCLAGDSDQLENNDVVFDVFGREAAAKAP